MNRYSVRRAVLFACTVTLASAAFAGLAAWAYSQLDPSEQLLLATSGLASGTPYIKTISTITKGVDHEHP